MRLINRVRQLALLRIPCMDSSKLDRREGGSVPSRQRSRFAGRLAIGILSLTTLVSFGSRSFAEDLPRAARMFPEQTQAFVALPDSERFLANWSKTELGKLAADARLRDFWESQQEEIKLRLASAGWQLSLRIDDLAEVSTGQAAMGWIARPTVTEKPYSVGLIVDVAGRDAQVDKFLAKIRTEMQERKASGKAIDHQGVTIQHYVLPKLPNDTRARDSYFAVARGQFVASDDLLTIQELLDAQTTPRTDSLEASPLYTKVQSRIVRDSHPIEIEYFVQPIGFGKLVRSITGKQAKGQVDILKLLEGQGFDRILCAAGSIQLAKSDLDMHHQGFILREEELPASVQILDFPNEPALIPPAWINVNSAGVLGFSWNFKDAFPKFKNLVDAYLGSEQFEGILDGIKNDPTGPQIDIPAEVLPYIGNEFYAVSEIVEPITPESKRTLIFVKLDDPENKLTNVLNRYSKTEVGSSIEDVGDYRVWKFSNDEGEEEIIEFNSGGTKKEEEDEEKPLLNNWAVSIVDGYFVFASNPEAIYSVLGNAQNKAQLGDFEKQDDVQKARAIQKKLSTNNGLSFSEIDLAERSFEMQYELFRAGILPQSRSLLAIIAERVLKTDKAKPQALQGNALPPFAEVKDFFTPTGMVVRTEKDGWGIDGFVLGKK